MNDEAPKGKADKADRPELTEAPEANEGSGRYAVYDQLLARYVSGVTDTKPSADEVKSYGDHAVVVEV